MKFSVYLLLLSLFLFVGSCNPPLNKRHLLVLGDSNGANQGWVYHLQNLRKGGPLVNTSLSGNTVGFSYDGTALSKNTLENLNIYLRKGYAEMGTIDEVLIALGTNDCKAVFADRHAEIAGNMETVLDRANNFFSERGQEPPRFVLISPPPVDDSAHTGDFNNATECTRKVTEAYRQIATDRGICFVDLQANPGTSVLKHSKDGIHFNAEGYRIISSAILEACY